MWTVLTFIIAALVLLTIVVFIHELGHFLVARWCGVKVQTFSIGFGKEIFGFYDKHGTRWCFARWPLGGYVRFIDDENAASAPSKAALDDMDQDARVGAFQTKPLWQRAAVVIAGPAFNIISAMLIIGFGAWALGTYDTPSFVDRIEANSVAARSGLKPGDRITGIDGQRIDWVTDLNRIVTRSPSRLLRVEYERDGQTHSAMMIPDAVERDALLGFRITIGDLGLRSDIPPIVEEATAGDPASLAGLLTGDRILAIGETPIDWFSDLTRIVRRNPEKPLEFTVERDGRTRKIVITPQKREADGKIFGYIGMRPKVAKDVRSFTPGAALRQGVSQTADTCWQVIASIPKLPAAIFKVFSFQRQSDIGGPAAIIETTGHAAKGGFRTFVEWLAVFSIMLGIMNLLPIPLLDGGHLLFYGLEAIRGRPLDERIQEISFKIGIAMIATMMTAAILSDVTRLGRLVGRAFGLG